MTAVPLTPAASRAAARGNHVRAALIIARSASLDAGGEALRPLWGELAAALALPPDHHGRLPALGRSLLGAAATSRLSREANVLFGLQTLTVDEHREEPYEYVSWIRSLGRIPYDRKRPLLRLVTKFRRLSGLVERLRRIDGDHRADARELADILERQRDRIRAETHALLRSVLEGTLVEVGLRGDAEATEEVVAVLLRQIDRWGATDFGDLRDALARHSLKMDDLGPDEVRRGRDALLALDERLAARLDGVHYQGEVYLKLLHRVQAPLFGTAPGRAVSRLVLGPLLLAGVLISFAEIVAEELSDKVELVSAWSVVGLAVVVSLFVNVAVLRRPLTAVGQWLWRRVAHHGPEKEKKPTALARLFQRIRWLYREAMDRFDASLYIVEEWVRFRGGARKGARSLEGLAALLIYALGYFVRFAFKLVIEPTINPIKHFPVVTVAGKISAVSLWVPVKDTLNETLPSGVAYSLATLIAIWFIPGFVGFITWELRFNWKLYRANAGPAPAPASGAGTPAASSAEYEPGTR